MKVDNKSNEITAISELLKLLEIKNCIITIDAMGCQKEIAREIIRKKADYVLAVKGNQSSLHDEVRDFFDLCFERKFEGIKHDYFETFDNDHGRLEKRKYWISDDIGTFSKEKEWGKVIQEQTLVLSVELY